MSTKKMVLDEYKSSKILIDVKNEWTIKEFLTFCNFPLDSVVHYDNQMVNRNLNQKWMSVSNFDKKKAIKVAPHGLDGIKH